LRLEHLIRFYRAPQAYFLSRRLGIDLREYDSSLSDREPLETDSLDGWEIGNALLQGLLNQRPVEQIETVLRGAGKLPWGHQGHLLLQQQVPIAESIAQQVRLRRAGAALSPQRVEVQLAAQRKLVGSVDNLWLGGFVEATFSRIAPKHRIASWIRHLAACASGANTATSLIGRDEKKPAFSEARWEPLTAQAAQKTLIALVDFYDQGLSNALPFLPSTSASYVDALMNPKTPKMPSSALISAINFYSKDDCPDTVRDPHPERAFGDDALPPFVACDPDNSDAIRATLFHRVATAVYEPLLKGLSS
jgi:exodeoxyribonuclease V gamma subunit